MKRLKDAFAQPILYPTAFQPPPGATEVMPTRLPPLRGDAGTLVVGKLPAGAASVCLQRRRARFPERRSASRRLKPCPAPEVENFFLVEIAGQWRNQKDQPALLQADRALAFAAEQHELAREDLLAKAYWALDEDKIDPAFKLFEQACRIRSRVARRRKPAWTSSLQIRDGKLTKEQLFEQVKQQRKATQGQSACPRRRRRPNRPPPPAAGRSGTGSRLPTAGGPIYCGRRGAASGGRSAGGGSWSTTPFAGPTRKCWSSPPTPCRTSNRRWKTFATIPI